MIFCPEQSPRERLVTHARAGELAYQRDPVSGRALHYPRAVAPSGATPEWRVSAGLGTVHSTTAVMRREGAFNVALIDMDEGFRLLARVDGIAAEQVRIGMRVRCRMTQTGDEDPYPVFALADGANA